MTQKSKYVFFVFFHIL